MTTRLDLRTSARRRLEDTGLNPLWDDLSLNAFIADAVRRYGARFPAERTATVTALTAVASLAVTPEIDAVQITRVTDPNGTAVPRQLASRRDGGPGGPASAQAWRWWNQTLLLVRPAALGDWRIDYLGGRTAPSDDVSAVEIKDGDDELIVLMTAATALRRRALEDGKRGGTRSAMDMDSAAEVFESLARNLIGGRVRRIRGGWFDTV